jgi:hypothetical protein
MKPQMSARRTPNGRVDVLAQSFVSRPRLGLWLWIPGSRAKARAPE